MCIIIDINLFCVHLDVSDEYILCKYGYDRGYYYYYYIYSYIICILFGRIDLELDELKLVVYTHEQDGSMLIAIKWYSWLFSYDSATSRLQYIYKYIAYH